MGTWTKEPWEWDTVRAAHDPDRVRAIQCVNACAGVDELGSVRELLIMLEKADEFIAAEGVPCYAPIRADIRNILARFRLEEDHD